MRNIVVIVGSGLMGSGIASCSALAGNITVLTDLSVDLAKQGLADAIKCVDELESNGLADTADAKAARELLSCAADFTDYAPCAKMVIEAIAENLELKQELFARLDETFPPEVPLLSNTSGLRISDIALKMKAPQRAVTAHFWFPGHLVPLVEVVVGDKTDPAMAAEIRDEMNRWGKAAVLVKQDHPGQLANRILQAVIREASSIVEMGLASPEDVDTAIKMGMGIRLPVWGPLEHVDAVGVDLCRNVQNTVLPGISAAQRACARFDELVEGGNLGYKTGRGFYDWSGKDMKALAARRNSFIIAARKFMKETK